MFLCCFLTGIHPESQAAAEGAVDAFRAEQLTKGVNVSADSPWIMEDYAVACHARLAPIDDLMLRLFEAVRQVFKALWPDVRTPREIGELTDWMANAPGRVDEWRASAARAGAEMALSFVLSWYEEVQLSQLATRRAGAEFPEEEMRSRAISIASFADVDTFIADPNEPDDSGAEDVDPAEVETDGLAEDEDAGDDDGLPPHSSSSGQF